MKPPVMRPHHGLCLILFSPEGHSAAYTSIMLEAIKMLEHSPQTEVILSLELDEICACCQYNHAGVCAKSHEVDPSDKMILNFCALKAGQKLSWEDFRRKLTANVLSADELARVCKGCMFLPRCAGVCLQISNI